MAKRGNSLIVKEQPLAEWYKDEGGKTNVLKFEVQSPIDLSEPLPLRCALHYESEAPVEEREQDIFNIANPRNLVLTPDYPACVIEFRIEKVSRRKDGQRFRVFVQPDFSHTRHKLPIQGVFSDPITVFSKRKTGERQISRRPSRPLVELPDESTASIKMLHGTLLQMQKTLDNVQSLAKKHERHLIRIETALNGGDLRIDGSLLPIAPLRLGMQQSTDSVLSATQEVTTRQAAVSDPHVPRNDVMSSVLAGADKPSYSQQMPYGSTIAANINTTAGKTRSGKLHGAAGLPVPANAVTKLRAPVVAASAEELPSDAPSLVFATSLFGNSVDFPPTVYASRQHSLSELGDQTNLLTGYSMETPGMQFSRLSSADSSGVELGSMLPGVELKNVKRLRSMDIVVDYSIPPAASAALPGSANGQAGEPKKDDPSAMFVEAPPIPADLPPLNVTRSLSRQLSTQTAEDVGAWVDDYVQNPAKYLKPSDSDAGVSGGHDGHRQAKLQVIEAFTHTGIAGYGVYTDDPTLAALVTAQSASSRGTSTMVAK